MADQIEAKRALRAYLRQHPEISLSDEQKAQLVASMRADQSIRQGTKLVLAARAREGM